MSVLNESEINRTSESFPTQLLPGLLKDYAQELANHYAAPPEAVVSLCLSILGAVMSPDARIKSGLGNQVTGSNLYLCIGVDRLSTIHEIAELIVSPLAGIQSEQEARKRSIDGKDLKAEANQIRQEQADYIRENAFPDPYHLTFFETQLAGVTLNKPSRVLVEDPLPNTLLPLIKESAQGAMLGIFDDLSLRRFLENLDTSKRESDLHVLSNGWKGQMLFQGGEDEKFFRDVPRPSLSLLCLCEGSELERMITHPVLKDREIAQQFIPVISEIKRSRINGNIFRALRYQNAWESLMRRWTSQHQGNKQKVYELSLEAQAILYRFRNQITDQLDSIPVEHRSYVEKWLENVWRITLILHACCDSTTKTVSQKTAEAAVALMRWYGSRQLKWLTGLQSEQGETQFERECDEMWKRIRAEGRIKRRDLFRTYHNQRREEHDPILNRLLENERVYYDAETYLVAVDNSTPPDADKAALLTHQATN